MDDIIHLAVAEDHKLMRQSLIDSLNAIDGFHVQLEAENGEILLNKLRHAKSLPDICLMDISMPVMDGHATTKEICKLFPDMKVLAVTMFKDDHNILRMLLSGACGYFTKDHGIEQLARAIKVLYRHGFYNSPTISNALKIMGSNKNNKSLVLTEKEILFLSMCCTKLTYKQIASKLCIGYRTISTFIDEIYRKIKLSTRLELAIFAIRVGIAPYNEKGMG